ncbi:Fanconi anemia core complex-associated protein 20 isoform X1 [Sphaeramia orbicularis]|uniref:Fanconi anemia core complex-associated protein 20 isoform X1 n=1 Tax=Sphaeramia orbicularis TaxID=375764 RepID=UPI00117FE112|nr:Fanconi anemia core complex-associated protein 20 isoform X1 [Sphaeramia orbicularis]
MAENYLKLKLKRKKCSIEDVHPGKLQTTSACSVRPSQAEGSRADAAVWWNREQLPAPDSLWTLTLRAALPYREDQHWDLVPDLPHPSTGRHWPQIPGEHSWCDLSEDVAPFPEPPPLSPRSPSSRDPVNVSFPQLDSSVQTKPMPNLSSKAPSTSCGQTHPTKPTFHSQGGPLSSERPSRVDVGERRTAENEAVVNRQPPVKQTGAPQQDDEEGGEGGRLQSCPMCLLVFPVGFTQMDCDGHLAQCLSEMNVDMTW